MNSAAFSKNSIPSHPESHTNPLSPFRRPDPPIASCPPRGSSANNHHDEPISAATTTWLLVQQQLWRSFVTTSQRAENVIRLHCFRRAATSPSRHSLRCFGLFPHFEPIARQRAAIRQQCILCRPEPSDRSHDRLGDAKRGRGQEHRPRPQPFLDAECLFHGIFEPLRQGPPMGSREFGLHGTWLLRKHRAQRRPKFIQHQRHRLSGSILPQRIRIPSKVGRAAQGEVNSRKRKRDVWSKATANSKFGK